MSTIHACYQPNAAVHPDLMTQMLSASSYWQPDETSQQSNPQQNCYLAKASLFNTTLSFNDNVYQDPISGNIICANTRLDNREELAEQLQLSKESLQELTDSQLILQSYQHWGEDCARYLLGDFVFVIWDESEQQIYAVRDHFGTKLLTYSLTEQGLMISNEPNAFFTSNWLKQEIKEDWLVDYIWSLGPSKVTTAYHNLKNFPAAHYMIFNGATVRLQRYWSLEDKPHLKGIDDDELIEQLNKEFSRAVEKRMDSEFPLACELSEGLDSNAIAGFAAILNPKQVIHTLSYECQKLTDENYPVWGKTYQEIFEMLEMHPNLKPVWTDETYSPDEAKRFVHNVGGVYAVQGASLWHCDLASRNKARVLFSGWGGDHCVSTYGDFYESELFSQFKWLKTHQHLRDKFIRGRGAKPFLAWGMLMLKHWLPPLFKVIKRKRSCLESALWERSKYSVIRPRLIKQKQLKQKLKRFTNNYHRKTVKSHHQRELFDVGVETRLIDSELSARQYKVEYRYPMLDVRLVELVYNFPSHLKCYKGVERFHFRSIMKNVTTKRIIWRLKSDVSHPNIEYNQALSNAEKKRLKTLLNSPLLQPYCHTANLEQSNWQARFSMNRFKSLYNNLHYFIENNLTIKRMT